MYRTATCGQLREKDEGKEVKLSGWVYRRRDHGGLIFVDLRDYYGYTQLVFDPKIDKVAWETAEQLRSEWVVVVKGKVRKRTPDTVNSQLKTGKIELAVSQIEI
jgi:aspartyl-tRNA synthetase